MLRHNLLLIYRNFKRFKGSFFINLIGLSAGLTCTLFIYLWVTDELSVDKFNEKDERLFRAMEHRKEAGSIQTSLATPGLLAETLMEEMPEVEAATPATWPEPLLISTGYKQMYATGRYADKDFFQMFSYPMIYGKPETVLKEKNLIVISDVLAMKLFNTKDCIGQSIEIDHKYPLQISGVYEAMPANASEQFEFVIPFAKFRENRDWLLNWESTGIMTFVLLKRGVDVDVFNAKISDMITRKTEGKTDHRVLFLKNYSDDYLFGRYENGILTGGRITYVKLFSIIAVFILLIACINFMNLSTAKALHRIKEVGIKKAIGASRRSLLIQYLGESVLMSFISLLVAILIVDLILPQFNIITGKQLSLELRSTPVFVLVVVTAFTGLFAGSYPALYLSAFRPAGVLKGKRTASVSEVWARKGLVVIQFSLSILFIVSVLVVYKQIEFVQSAYLGYDKNNLIYFPLTGSLSDTKNQESLISQIKSVPGVENASSTSHPLSGHNGATWAVEWEGKNQEDRTEFEVFTGNYDLIETLGMEMTEGRPFSREFISDTSGIIFNENAIQFMGLSDPVGKNVKLWNKEMKIIGVVKDFHFESLHEPIKPIFFRVEPYDTYYLMAKIKKNREKEALIEIGLLYKKINPEFPFEYNFVDQISQTHYASEERVAILSRYFAGLAILISCLGLFGLAAFTTERRLKEIGIRKVLGSSVFGIVYLLSSDFTKIILLSILVALPISYFSALYWLDSFAFKISLQWWYFVGAGLLALVIAWLTVGTQAIKAARANPTQCLKNE